MDHWGQMPNRRVREGDLAPMTPAQKRNDRRRERRTVRTVIHQFIGAQVMDDADYYDIEEEE